MAKATRRLSKKPRGGAVVQARLMLRVRSALLQVLLDQILRDGERRGHQVHNLLKDTLPIEEVASGSDEGQEQRKQGEQGIVGHPGRGFAAPRITKALDGLFDDAQHAPADLVGTAIDRLDPIFAALLLHILLQPISRSPAGSGGGCEPAAASLLM
ncbi:MAG: hypothetical protein AMJ93_15455 [Anaerolineae bacterium SM23_84]|nr:MAG: hypothetical protein AMJ93_15455 [Anaerolineae bacterium SM23_84]